MPDNTFLTIFIDAMANFFPEIEKFKSLPPGIFSFFIVIFLVNKLMHAMDLNHLTQTYMSLRKRKFSEIKERLIEKKECDDSYLPLQEFVEAYDFKLATGIYADSPRRKDLIKLHNINPRVNSWVRIGRALDFINEFAEIRELTTTEKNERKLFSFLGKSCEIFAGISLIFTGLFGLFDSTGSHQSLLWLGYMIVFALCGVFFHRQTWPYISAEIINKQIVKAKENNEKQNSL